MSIGIQLVRKICLNDFDVLDSLVAEDGVTAFSYRGEQHLHLGTSSGENTHLERPAFGFAFGKSDAVRRTPRGCFAGDMSPLGDDAFVGETLSLQARAKELLGDFTQAHGLSESRFLLFSFGWHGLWPIVYSLVWD